MNSQIRHKAQLSCNCDVNPELPLFQSESAAFDQYSPACAPFSLPSELCQDKTYRCHEKPVAREHRRNAPGTRDIPLTRGLFALVDESDFEAVSAFHWGAFRWKKGSSWYASGWAPGKDGKKRTTLLHHFILGVPPGTIIDHKDLDGLNNTRANIRIATRSQNARNIPKPKYGITSAFKGVCWYPEKGRFRANIFHDGKGHHLGYFASEVDAAWTYDREARLRFGEFARCNFPPPPMLLPEVRA